MRRPLCGPRRVRGDPVSELRLRAGVPAHVPRSDAARHGVRATRDGTRTGGAYGGDRHRAPGNRHRPPRYLYPDLRGERRAASRVHHRRPGGRPGHRHPASPEFRRRIRRPRPAFRRRPGRRRRGDRRRGSRPADPAAGRPARRGGHLPPRHPAAARRLRVAGLRRPAPLRRRPAAFRSRGTRHHRRLVGARLGPFRRRPLALRRGPGHGPGLRRSGPGGTRLLQHRLPRPRRRPAPRGGACRAGRPAGRQAPRLAPAAVAARPARGGRLGGAGRPYGLRAGAGPGAAPLRGRAARTATRSG